ncbi:MAG: hypothetical protein ACXABI_02105 [Candidatus Hodarchaeales archaeon]
MLHRSYCPYRVEISEHRPGCVLQRGKKSLCYSTDQRPLIQRDDEIFYCPLITKVLLSKETIQDIEKLVSYIFTIQDQESTAINLWPMLTGIANSKNKAMTPDGKAMEKLSVKVRKDIVDVIFEME